MKPSRSRWMSRVLPLTAACSLLLSAPIADAADFFLQSDTLKGDAVARNFAGAIAVSSFSFGAGAQKDQPVGSGRAAARPSFQQLTITKSVDSASPAIYEHVLTGKAIPSLTLSAVKAPNPSAYFTIKLWDATLDAVTTSGAGELQESVTISFSRISLEYHQVDARGQRSGKPIVFGWDIKQNKPLP
jgi:type VI secretion system secreted protein Hcp